MATVHAELTGDRAVLRRNEFEHLLELARRTEPVEVQAEQEDPEVGLARLALQGRAFDFWNESGEETYSDQDGEAI
ncbi:MAG TPA: hypothetical protein VMX16_00260 [Terriglobia bacterium]|nr:hypothetical protein [Terriglobia bacterium]